MATASSLIKETIFGWYTGYSAKPTIFLFTNIIGVVPCLRFILVAKPLEPILLTSILIQRLNSGSGTEIINSSTIFPKTILNKLLKITSSFNQVSWPDNSPSTMIWWGKMSSWQFVLLQLVRPDLFRAVFVPMELFSRWNTNPFFIELNLKNPEKVDGPIYLQTPDNFLSNLWSVPALASILKSEKGPNFLGAAQAILDGNKVVFPVGNETFDYVRKLVFILPRANRMEVSFALIPANDSNGFNIFVENNPLQEPIAPGIILFEKAGDYPEGNFEYSLQWAVEHEDESMLARLFFRKSTNQVFRMSVALLAIVSLIPIILGILKWLFP